MKDPKVRKTKRLGTTAGVDVIHIQFNCTDWCTIILFFSVYRNVTVCQTQVSKAWSLTAVLYSLSLK